MKITKKREKILHTALCLDDILYEKHRRLTNQLQKDAQRLIYNRKKLFKVIKKGKDYDEVLQIKEVKFCDDGAIVYI